MLFFALVNFNLRSVLLGYLLLSFFPPICLNANSADLDQMQHYVVSYLGFHDPLSK